MGLTETEGPFWDIRKDERGKVQILTQPVDTELLLHARHLLHGEEQCGMWKRVLNTGMITHCRQRKCVSVSAYMYVVLLRIKLHSRGDIDGTFIRDLWRLSLEAEARDTMTPATLDISNPSRCLWLTMNAIVGRAELPSPKTLVENSPWLVPDLL